MGVIRFALTLYMIVVILDVALEFLPKYKDNKYAKYIAQFSAYTVNPIRKFLSPDVPYFASHALVVVLIYLLKVIW